jgi:hypothetical protein
MIHHPLLDRRQFLAHTVSGLGGIALWELLNRQGFASSGPIRPDIPPANPNAPRNSHFSPRAKQVLMIFCSGAVSQVDTFDFKPELRKRHGQPMPGAEGQQGDLNRSPWEFQPRGQSGKMVSDLVPNLGALSDELCFIHSLTGKTNTHGPGENFMATGFTLDGFPSMGAWATYALGSENDTLPAYVAIPDPRGAPQSAGNFWGSGFLPAAFQGTDFNATSPLRNLSRPRGVGEGTDKTTRDFLAALNAHHLQRFPGDTELAARLSSYELAARMQLSVPLVADIAKEPEHILRMYGADQGGDPVKDLKAAYARNCILARRLVEKGVRFVQIFNGAYQTGGEGVSNWDGHKTLEKQYVKHGEVMDQPTAALIMDLKQRGLLADTLVVWCTEFGRMPTFQKGASGRDHNPSGFTAFLAGAGVKKGFSYGATDEFGYKAVENVATVHDFHATILELLGLHHDRLSFYHNGIERRLTDVHGNVIRELLA